jgi:hypothetical protein
LVVVQPQLLQIRQVAQRCRDAPCTKLNEKSDGQSALTTSKIEKKLTFEFVVAEIQLHQIPKLSKGFGDAPYERDQKKVEKSWSVGYDRRQK